MKMMPITESENVYLMTKGTGDLQLVTEKDMEKESVASALFQGLQ